MGVQLGDATALALDQLLQLGLISEYDMSLGGIQDRANTLLLENIYGTGSTYEKELIAPEMQDTFNALLNEANDILRGGGAIDSDMSKGIMDALFAYDQTAYGMTGSDLMQGALIDIGRIDEVLGTTHFTDTYKTELLQAIRDMSDPTKNPALMGLQAALLDAERYKPENFGKDAGTLAELAGAEFDSMMSQLGGLEGKDFDEALAAMITQTREAIQLENWMNLNSELVDTVMNLSGLNLLLESFGLKKPETPTRHGRGGGVGGRNRPTTASSISHATTSSTSTVNQRLRNETTVNMNVEGLGLKEALALIRDEAERAARNVNQRSATVGQGLFRNSQGLVMG